LLTLPLLCAAQPAPPAEAQPNIPRDEFYWLGQMNKATAVINTDEGLLDKSLVPRIAAGIAKVLKDGSQPGAKRPSSVISFEPLLIEAAGPEVTLLHAVVPARTCTPPTGPPACVTTCSISPTS
jgi:argininosuccinate lyase